MQNKQVIFMYSAFTKMLPSVKYIKKQLKYKKINPRDAKVLFVPFADISNKLYIARCKQALALCGIDKNNISTLTSHTHKNAKADIIFVCGGNVCKLKDELTKIDWLDEIKNRINNGTIYIGDSAGSVLLGSTIKHTLEYEPYDNALQNYDGLKIINKGIVVHFSLTCYSGTSGVVEDPDCYNAHIRQTEILGEGNFLTIANNQMYILLNGKLKSKSFSYKAIDKAHKIESSKYGKQFAKPKNN